MSSPTRTITWLHLSDLHLRLGDVDRFRDLLAPLWEDIRKQVGESPVDLIFFTGDLAWSGISREYEEAVACFLDPLLRATSVEKERLFVVPGNHDVNWEALRLLNTSIPKQLNDPNETYEFLNRDGKRGMILAPMGEYRRFVSDYYRDCPAHICARDPLYGYAQVVELNGLSVAVIGL